MIRLPYFPDYGLPILGLLVTFVGACWAARAVIIDDKTARKLATPRLGPNEALRQALLSFCFCFRLADRICSKQDTLQKAPQEACDLGLEGISVKA